MPSSPPLLLLTTLLSKKKVNFTFIWYFILIQVCLCVCVCVCVCTLSILLTLLWNTQSRECLFTFDKWRNWGTEIGQPRSRNQMKNKNPGLPWPISIYVAPCCCQMNMIIKAELKWLLEVQSAPCGPLIDVSFQRANTNPDVIYTEV